MEFVCSETMGEFYFLSLSLSLSLTFFAAREILFEPLENRIDQLSKLKTEKNDVAPRSFFLSFFLSFFFYLFF